MQKINNILPTLSLLPFCLDSFIVDRKLLITKSLSEKLEIIADKILLVQTIEIFLAESIDQQNIGIQRIKLFLEQLCVE